MVPYYGDFAEDDTVLIPFNTFTSDDPAASSTITNLADADIKVHKDGGLTQIVTDGATVIINFDSITGNHLITIDTSVHADYAVGSEYTVRIEGTTVDGATINAWVGAFSIERAGGVLALLKGTNSLANIEDKIDILDTVADGIQTDLSNATDGLGALKTLLDAIPTTAMRGTDSAALASEVTAVRMATLTDWIDGGRLDLLLDAIKVVTDQMVFTKANELDTNMQSINGAAIVGDGNATPFDGA